MGIKREVKSAADSGDGPKAKKVKKLEKKTEVRVNLTFGGVCTFALVVHCTFIQWFHMQKGG